MITDVAYFANYHHKTDVLIIGETMYPLDLYGLLGHIFVLKTNWNRVVPTICA